jgi:hypothetical protein
MGLATAQILPANMVFWTRADSGVRSDGSGFVTDWYDQTANQNNAQQYFGLPLEPTLVPGAMNGLPAIRFDGGTNYLQSASSPSLAMTGDMTIYVAINFADYAAGRQILGKTLINQPASYDYYILNSTTTRFLRGNGSASVAIAATTTPSAGATHVMGVTMQGTTVAHFLDGFANGGGTLSTAMTDAGTPFRIGSRHDLLQYMKGDIAEIMIFNSALSANERLIVNNYLGVKYLPFSFTLQPTNDTKLEGQTATFYVGASQGGAAFNYQWLRYGTNVVGATNAAYTTPLLTMADDQSTYTALVWVSGGPTNVSSTATLTVLPDNVLPTVVAAGKKIWSQTEIVVVFSEGVTPITATNTGNYQLDNGALVTSAAMGDASNKVVLATTVTNGGTYLLTVQNVKDFFNNTMIATQVPVTYYPFAVLWVKGDAGITADGSGFVSQWDDQSGYGNNLLQSFGPPYAPVVVTNGFNGKTSLHFASGQTNYLLTASPSAASLTFPEAMSIYTIARFDDYLSFNGLVEKTTGNLPSPFDYYLLSGSGIPRLLRGDALTSQSVVGISAPSLGTPHIVSVILQSPVFMVGASVTHYLDGTANGTGTINTPINDLGDPVSVGSRGNLGTAMHGDFAEILLFNSALSTTDRQSLDLYLGNKYAILLGPVPKISFGPAVGGTVPLSWPTPNLTYVLESTPGLSSPAWAPVPNTVTTANGTNTVSINTTNDLQFFRLHKQ